MAHARFGALGRPRPLGCDRQAATGIANGSSRAFRCEASAGPSHIHALGLTAWPASKKEIRNAYVERMKSIHPDVSRLDEEAATKAATALNLAYEAALEALGQEKIRGPGSFAPMDEFDRTLGPPCELFVNPFASNSDVMLWREIQQVARGSSDPEAALRLRGVFMRPSAIQYVTVEQLQALYEQLAHMEATMDFESTAWFLTDMLARARRSNDRQQPRS